MFDGGGLNREGGLFERVQGYLICCEMQQLTQKRKGKEQTEVMVPYFLFWTRNRQTTKQQPENGINN